MDKQKFSVHTNKGKVRVQLERKPGYCVTKSGQYGGIKVTALVLNKHNQAAYGEAVCVMGDDYTFAEGAKRALAKALSVKIVVNGEELDYVSYETRQLIWKEFLRFFPPEKK